MLRLITSCALALILAGCAGKAMDQAQCGTADWRAIGYEDGSQGRGATALGQRRKACADHGVTPNFEAYMAGHGRGIAAFCRPQNGYRLGTRGYRYGGMCPADLEGAFLDAHADGLGLYQRRATVNRLRKRINRNHNRSKKIERQMAKKTASLVSRQIPPSLKLTIGVELKQLTEERIAIERSISQLENDLRRARQDYRGYSDSLAHR
jgi:hypothetical protein